MKKLFPALPDIRSEDVELRPLEACDAESLRELTESDEVYRFLPTFLFEKKFDSPEAAIRRMYDEGLESSLILGIFSNGEFCGLAEFYGYRAPFLKISVGYRLLPRCWGKGIATKALGLMVGYLFRETNVKVVTASVMPENSASANVLKKNGFRCIARATLENWGYPLPTQADKWLRTAAGYRRSYKLQS